MTVRGYQLAVDWSRQGLFTGPEEDVSSAVPKSPNVVVSWGRSDPRALTDPSSAKLTFALINTSRKYSPENLAGPLSGDVLPGTPVRLNVTDPATGAITTLFLGPIDTLDADTGAAAKDLTVSCLDGWSRPGSTQLSTPVYQGMRTGDLIGVILDAIGWTGGRAIDPGATLVPYWWAEGQDAATAVLDLVHSEGPPALAYVMGGTFVFRDRHHRLTDRRSLSSRGTFTHLKPTGQFVPATDTFSRTVASGWGAADTGQAWTTSGGVAADFNVGSGVGTQSHSAVNVSRRAVLAAVQSEQIQATVSVPAVATGAALNAAVTLRNLDPANDHYRAQLAFGLAGALSLSLIERSGGGDSTLASVGLTDTYAAGTQVTVKARMDGATLKAKAWLTGGAEPDWQVYASDKTIGSGYPPGVRTVVATGNTNTLPVVFSVDSVTVTPTDCKVLRDTFGYQHGLDQIVNQASLEVSTRLPTGPRVVWSTDLPITLGAGETQVFVVSTDDPFINLITPTSPISFLDDGTYTYDYHLASGAVTFSLSRTSGQSAYLTITAGGGGAILDQGLKIRGTPLQATPARKFTQSDPSSIATFGANTWDGSAPWAYLYDADVITQRIVSVYAQARPSVVLDFADVDAAHLTTMLGLRVSDRITVRNDELGLNTDFMVEQITHSIQSMGVIHRVTVGCQIVDPVQPGNPFTFDLAGSGFDQGAFGMTGVPDGASMFIFDTAGQGFDQGRFAS